MRSPPVTRRLVIAGPAALAASNALVGGAGAQQAMRLTIALPSDLPSLDPTLDTSPIGQNVRLNIYDQLTEVGADGAVRPRLATSWQSSPDGLTWDFTLRTDVVCHDGEPLGVDDVIFTYQKIIADPKSIVYPYLAKVNSIERVADDKLRIVLKEAYAPFERQVSLVSIAQKKAYERLGAAQFGQAPVGSGPYRLVRWVRDDRIELEAFPRYWNGAAKIPSVSMRPVKADASRASALSTGEVDLVPLLPPTFAERLGERQGVRTTKIASHRVVYVSFNTEEGVIGKVAFRRSVDKAIDRRAICTSLLRGYGAPIGQMVAPATFGYDPSLEPTAFDVEGAKALLKESGYGGEAIPLQFSSNYTNSGDGVAEAVAGYLRAIGINVRLERMEFTAYFSLWSSKKLSGMQLFAFGPTSLDADLPLLSLFESGSTRGSWTDPKVDALVRAQRAESDSAKRRALIADIWKITRENVYYSPLYNEINVWGMRDRVKVAARPDGIVRLRDVELTGA